MLGHAWLAAWVIWGCLCVSQTSLARHWWWCCQCKLPGPLAPQPFHSHHVLTQTLTHTHTHTHTHTYTHQMGEWGISHLVACSSALKDAFQRNLSFAEYLPSQTHAHAHTHTLCYLVLRREWRGRDADTRDCSFNFVPLFTHVFCYTSSLHKHDSTNKKPCCVKATSVLFRARFDSTS